VPKADKLAGSAGYPERGIREVFAPVGLCFGGLCPLLLIDIVERERETQAAGVLAGPGVTWDCRNNGRMCLLRE
jgi:hypothetical protein